MALPDLKSFHAKLAQDLEGCCRALRDGRPAAEVAEGFASAIIAALVTFELHPEMVQRDPVLPN